MLLIIGLGNPGKEYEGTRHNTGFDVVEAVSKKLEVKSKKWTKSHRAHAEMIERKMNGQCVILAKPTIYMNESGKAVSALVKGYRLSAIGYRLLILHDDLDLPVGTLRISVEGSSGGHKGVQSIIDALGTMDFIRLRIGIGPNETPDGHRIPAEKFVLEKFRITERPKIDATVARAVEAIEILLRNGLPAAQQFANG